MEVALRRKQAPGGWWRGLGDDTTVDPTTTDGSLESQLIAAGVDPADAGAYSALPGGSTGMPSTTGPDLTPDELAAEQARASSWLAQNTPAILNATTKAALTAAQISSGVAAGALKPSSTCPSGYLVAGSAQCVNTAQGTAAPLVAGLPNSTLAMVVGGFLLLMILSKGGGRR